MDWYNRSEAETLRELGTSESGLSDGEASKRLARDGENKLKEVGRDSIAKKFFLQFTDVMVIVLIAAAIISAVIAVVEKQYSDFIDVGIILAIVLLNAVIGTVQECKAEKAMESLKKMSAPYCKVRRGGEIKKIETTALVKGDVVILEAGDVVPADMRLIKSASLKAESATLTGESVSEEKFTHAIADVEIPLADRDNMLFGSSTVTYGHGEGVVTATGMDAEIGKIASMLDTKEKNVTPLQKKLNKTGKFISIAVLAIAAAVFVIGILSAVGTGSVTVDKVLDSFMTAVALAVAAIPESLTAVITIIMALGVQKLSKANAIIKKLPAVETLGSTNVICSDKTGTLTLNRMTVKTVYADGTFEPNAKSNSVERLLRCMCFCNDTIVRQDDGFLTMGDPTETALVDYAHTFGVDKPALDKSYPRIDEIPFDSERKLMTTVQKENGEEIIYTKGAADILVKLCTHIIVDGKKRRITQDDISAIEDANRRMADSALRVLAYAYKQRTSTDASTYERDLVFIGLTGMIDPPREEVKSAVELCKSAGINVVMITGDNRNTAVAIATQLGICHAGKEAITGAELERMSDDMLIKRVREFHVYARVSPEHKVRIVRAWKANGMIVAMTGDGVNDAPSIKAADIGIGMGITGTEVTKEAADMVLADDNFATIVSAVKQGRTIFANMQKTIQYLLAANIAEVLSLFLSTLIFAFGKDPIVFLLPLQILWVNLVTDSLPALALGMEPPEGDVMKNPPLSSSDNLFAGQVGINIIYQGILQTGIVLGVFLGCAFTGWGHEVGTTMSFLTLCLVQLFHSFNARSLTGSIFNKNFFKNKMLFIAFFVGSALTIGLACLPITHDIFALQWLNFAQWLTVLLCSFSIIPAVEIVKLCMEIIRDRKEKKQIVEN
ncbi:MAG: calcium-translocating P-type ATPase, PMCA-type [Clostridiales bacterium]|nr:calcium-translocating P-type ATPase, PMCA-type [Clostridiales bacterium]